MEKWRGGWKDVLALTVGAPGDAAGRRIGALIVAGANIDFALEGGDDADTVTVFTTRPDTLLGVSYVVIAPEHPLAIKVLLPPAISPASAARRFRQTAHRLIALASPQLAAAGGEHAQKLREYMDVSASRSDMERTTDKAKTGVFTGARVRHPLSGEMVPLWTSDYVLSTYGTGAVMAVPAHDERDFEFASKFGLPIKQAAEACSLTGGGALVWRGAVVV